jgi:N-acetylmuramoyl-L-alanine amidase
MSTDIPVSIEGDDVWVRNVKASWFGGPNDREDSGETASGVNTRAHPDVLGCALPMAGFHHPATNASPIPRLPWFTQVQVTNTGNGKTVHVPLIDLGPALNASSHAAIDLTEMAFVQLGGKPNAGIMDVTFSIPGGARYMPKAAPDVLKTVSLRNSLPPGGNGAPLNLAPADDGHGISHGIDKPVIKKFIHSPNYSSRNGVKIDMVVMHFTDGPTARGAIDRFLNQSEQVSAHYIIDRNGDIYQMVADDDKAWHARAANPRSIGIEHVAVENQMMSSEQEISSVALVGWLIATYSIPLSNIVGHRFSPGNAGHTDCPNHLFGPATKAAVDAWVAKHFGAPAVA